ncbi:MAG: hypothetical protein ACQERM_10670 [Methanobacteriota archaeon]
MTRSDDWTWEFRPPAARAFEGLDTPIQQRIVSKLDDIVTDEWRDPPEYIEPISGVPRGKFVSVTFGWEPPRIVIEGSW